MSDTAVSTDVIEKTITLSAPASRVWRALTDHREFGTWFRVELEGPFIPGEVVRGRVTYPGYEGLAFAAQVTRIEPEILFAFRWAPGIPEPGTELEEPLTLVEFRLKPWEAGTVLTVRESGFAALPPERRSEALRLNTRGWAEQMEFIRAHVDG